MLKKANDPNGVPVLRFFVRLKHQFVKSWNEEKCNALEQPLFSQANSRQKSATEVKRKTPIGTYVLKVKFIKIKTSGR
jgi:hypothetical protein